MLITLWQDREPPKIQLHRKSHPNVHKNDDRILPVEDHIVPTLWWLIKKYYWSTINDRIFSAKWSYCFKIKGSYTSVDLSAKWSFTLSHMNLCLQCNFFHSNLILMFPIYSFCYQSHKNVSNVRFCSQSNFMFPIYIVSNVSFQSSNNRFQSTCFQCAFFVSNLIIMSIINLRFTKANISEM